MIWRLNVRLSCVLACLLPWAAHAADVDPGKDPVPSVMWAFYHKQLLADAPFVFDERVKLLAPPFAEDARQVPLEIDARAFKGRVVRIFAWAELNPLPKIVDFQPKAGVLPWLKSALQISSVSNRLNTKRCPGASTRPTTRERLPSARGVAGISATCCRVTASNTLTPPGW